MGAGKGAVEGWIAVVKPGRILFEVAGVSEEVAREALRLASHKLPVKTKFVKRENWVVKQMKAKEIRDLTTSEIEEQIKSSKEAFNLRFQLATGQLEETARIRTVKKNNCTSKTVAREREIERKQKLINNIFERGYKSE